MKLELRKSIAARPVSLFLVSCRRSRQRRFFQSGRLYAGYVGLMMSLLGLAFTLWLYRPTEWLRQRTRERAAALPPQKRESFKWRLERGQCSISLP